MLSAWPVGRIARTIPTWGLILVGVVASSFGFAQAPAADQGKVKVEWLGHEFYR